MGLSGESASDAPALLKAAHGAVGRRLRFNERYYLHPTDQGFKEMEVSHQGRCEDLTNMQTYAARSLALYRVHLTFYLPQELHAERRGDGLPLLLGQLEQNHLGFICHGVSSGGS